MDIKPKFKIVLYKEAEEFLQHLDEKTQKKIVDNMYKASVCLDPVLLKKLTGDIWEFRTKYMSIQYRLLAFWDKHNGQDTLVIATHGFTKKTSKVPQKEIKKALKIKDKYFSK